jgi:hypothetical protein
MTTLKQIEKALKEVLLSKPKEKGLCECYFYEYLKYGNYIPKSANIIKPVPLIATFVFFNLCRLLVFIFNLFFWLR